jgi:PAS domain S-box-containing protein
MDAREHVEAILDTVGEGVITIDADQRIRLVNREVERIFGYGRDELLGCGVHVLMPDEYRARHEAGFAARLNDPEPANAPTYRQFEGVRKDGSRFPLELRFAYVESGGAIFFTAAVRDVTERERARTELQAKSAEIERLNEELERERDYLREEVKASGGFGRIVGESAALGLVLAQIEAVARTDATVLVQGESGVGKELVARAIHEQSPRAHQPLVRVNCASVPESLFESEFFGHRKGAFTGAVADREGRFQLADGGTIFLDEIGEVPLTLQSKLLRVLQERQFEPLGDDRTRTVDVRVIAATNRDLAAEVSAGNFREDLYYRLGVFPLLVPPLREREGDVLLLARHFLAAAATRLGTPEPALSPEAERALVEYDWPGNARELQNVVERAVILATGGRIEPWMVGSSSPALAPRARAGAERSPRALDRAAIEAALERHGGVIKRAAEDLGLSRQALYRRLDRLGLRE